MIPYVDARSEPDETHTVAVTQTDHTGRRVEVWVTQAEWDARLQRSLFASQAITAELEAERKGRI